ncbi:MAG: fused protease/ribonucleoside-triphosphate reductase [Candidatus Thorarchaeota archaeon]
MQYFKVSETFLKEYDGRQPNWGYGALSYFTFKRTYARNIEDEDRTEEFWETLRRVVEGVFTIQKMHCNHHRLIWDNRRAQRSAQAMFKKMWEFKFLPPGRGLWAMGTPMVYEKGSAALNNCGFVSTKDISKGLASPFCWAMDMLMLGVGIGFDTKGRGFVVKAPQHTDAIHIIPDTREGWVQSLEIVLSAFEGRQLPKFDYSKLRKKGTPIKGFGGVASGPEPLRKLHEAMVELLTQLIDEELTSVNIVDMMNFIGRCVVSGNVRRSAEIAIGDIDDTYFINMKNPDLFEAELLSHRWASNNSVFVRATDDLREISKLTAKNGEPNYIFHDNIIAFGRMCDAPDYVDADYAGMNPCVEQVLESYELCNVVETFPGNHEDDAEFLDTLKYAYMYAKSVTLIPTHDPRTNAVMLRNRRIGLSHSGIEQAKQKFGSSAYYRDFCDAGYQVVKKWDHTYSRWLCISNSKRYTSVKPSGTVSLLAGAFPGVHYPHSEYYLRAVRVASNSPLIATGSPCGIQFSTHRRTQESWLHCGACPNRPRRNCCGLLPNPRTALPQEQVRCYHLGATQ